MDTEDLTPVNHPPGTRLLYSHTYSGIEHPQEMTIVEWSSGGRVRVSVPTSDNTHWIGLNDIERMRVLEVLPPIKNGSGDIEPTDAAKKLGRRGGKAGGLARAAALTPERRKEIALKAAEARWNKTGT